MKHIHPVSSLGPRQAQFESILQFVNLLSSVLGLFVQFATVFGLPIPQKGSNAT